MAVLFNATVTQGLLVTPDNSGQIQFQLNGVNVPSPTVAPCFSAYLSGAGQSITTSVWTKIQFNAKDFDTNSNFDATTNYRFQPLVAGYYQVNLSASNGNSGNTQWGITCIYKNNSQNKYGTNALGTGNGLTSATNALVYLNGTTDYIEGWMYVAVSTTINSGANNTFFQASLVRAA